jgi:hypothetical protein
MPFTYPLLKIAVADEDEEMGKLHFLSKLTP